MSRFYTNSEAAAAIAELVQPNEPTLREEVANCYRARIYDDLCSGNLTGRDRTTRLPIQRRDLAGAIALSSCLIAEADLNEWLRSLRIGVQLHNAGDLPHGDEGDCLLLAEKDRILRVHGGRVPGGVYLALAKKYRIGPRSAKHRCGLAEKRRDEPANKVKLKPPTLNWNPRI